MQTPLFRLTLALLWLGFAASARAQVTLEIPNVEIVKEGGKEMGSLFVSARVSEYGTNRPTLASLKVSVRGRRFMLPVEAPAARVMISLMSEFVCYRLARTLLQTQLRYEAEGEVHVARPDDLLLLSQMPIKGLREIEGRVYEGTLKGLSVHISADDAVDALTLTVGETDDIAFIQKHFDHGLPFHLSAEALANLVISTPGLGALFFDRYPIIRPQDRGELQRRTLAVISEVDRRNIVARRPEISRSTRIKGYCLGAVVTTGTVALGWYLLEMFFELSH